MWPLPAPRTPSTTKTGKMPMDSPLIFVLASFAVVAIVLIMIFRSK
jgi:hypothetical protein